MRIAILSDIHGNIVALNEALKDAKMQGVNEYIVLGDIITDFPFTNETIDKVKQLTPYVIQGNREEYLLNYEKTKENNIWKTIQHNSVCCYYNYLRNDNKEYIRNLPKELILEFEGVKIKAVHATPNSTTELLYFDTPQMEEMFNELQEDVLVYGHTHGLAQHEKKSNKTIVQVGTLGMHNNALGKSQYTIMDCDKGKIKLEVRTIDYDVNILKEEIEKNGGTYEEAKTWQNLCYCTVATGHDIRKDFCRLAKQEMIQKYQGNLPEGIGKNFGSFDDDIYLKVANQFKKYIFL